MANMIITCVWTMTGPLHIGSGLSRAGDIDQMVRTDGNGRAVIPGDAIKGAVRQSSELLLRWLLHPQNLPYNDRDSFPDHPVIHRIFSPNEKGPFYRFCTPKLEYTNTMPISSTAIKRPENVAMDNSLRKIENVTPEANVSIKIEGENGFWNESTSYDYNDMLFLASAIVATEGIGGNKGTGLGKIKITKLVCTVDGAALQLDWNKIVPELKKKAIRAFSENWLGIAKNDYFDQPSGK